MRIVQVSSSDVAGGAARAAWRLHQALRHEGIDSRMVANDARSGDWTVSGPGSKAAKLSARLRPHLSAMISTLQTTSNPVIHSAAVLPGGIGRRIEALNGDIINLHWINGEMCSIAELGRLPVPAVWTMHDMWPFTGAEHYTTDLRWHEGYHHDNRPPGHGRIDLNRWTWERKRRHWTRPLHLIAPSNWLADCARGSALMGDWPVSVIPNPIDLTLWSPVERVLARQLMNLPQDRQLVLFGAMGGTSDPRKGADLLLAAVSRLAQSTERTKIDLVIFGQGRPERLEDIGFHMHYAGHLHDEISLRLLYSACNLFVLPSRQDNLPNTGVEAQACGTPVVAFDTGGLPDIVRHHETGYLAQPFDVDDLARGIAWCLGDEARWQKLSTAATTHARARFHAPVVAARYAELYREVLDREVM